MHGKSHKYLQKSCHTTDIKFQIVHKFTTYG